MLAFERVLFLAKRLSRKNRNWLQPRFPRLLRHMRSRPNIFSIENPIKDKFYQVQDMKVNLLFHILGIHVEQILEQEQGISY